MPTAVPTGESAILLPLWDSNAGVVAQLFNQLVQDGVILKPRKAYEPVITGDSLLWAVTLEVVELLGEGATRRHLFYSEPRQSRREAAGEAFLKAAELLAITRTPLTYKGRVVVLVTKNSKAIPLIGRIETR